MKSDLFRAWPPDLPHAHGQSDRLLRVRRLAVDAFRASARLALFLVAVETLGRIGKIDIVMLSESIKNIFPDLLF